MNKRAYLAGSLLTLAIFAAPSAQAQTMQSGYTPPYYVTQSQAYGSNEPVYAPKAAASGSGSSYQSTHGAFSPISDRILSDPLYLPLQNQLVGVTAFSADFQDWTTYNSAGIKRSNNSSEVNNFTQNLIYGVSDEFSIRLGETYAFGHGYGSNQITGTDSTSSVSGFTDPTFGAAYRFIDQRRGHGVSATADLSYTPDMIESQTAGGGESGNIAAGRQGATATVDLGREMKNLTIDGFAGLSYLGARHYQNAGNGNNFEVDPFWNYFFGMRSQIRFTNRVSLNLGYSYTTQGNTTNTNDTSGLSFEQDNPDYSDFSIALNYHFVPNRLVGQISYDYYDYSDRNNTYPTAPNFNTSVKDNTKNVVGARLSYVFN